MAQAIGSDGKVHWRNLKTGLLFLVGLVVLGWLGFYVSKGSGLFSADHLLYLFTPDVQGLQEGNFVGISGKKVGTVKALDFMRRGEINGIRITLDIQGEKEFALITKDSKAAISGVGILGDKVIQIGIGHSKELVKEGDELPLEIVPGMDALTSSAISVMKNVNELTGKINRGEGTLGKLITTDELNGKINSALANLNAVEERIMNGKGLVPKLLNDPAFAASIQQTSIDLSELTSKLKQGDGALGKFLLGDQFLTKLNRVSDHTDSLIAQLGNPKGSLAKFSQDPAMYDNLNASIQSAHTAIGSLDSLLKDFKLNPNRYVHVSVF